MLLNNRRQALLNRLVYPAGRSHTQVGGPSADCLLFVPNQWRHDIPAWNFLYGLHFFKECFPVFLLSKKTDSFQLFVFTGD